MCLCVSVLNPHYFAMKIKDALLSALNLILKHFVFMDLMVNSLLVLLTARSHILNTSVLSPPLASH